MKEPPKFIQICSSKDQAYLLYRLTADGKVYGFRPNYYSSGLGNVPARWLEIVEDHK